MEQGLEMNRDHVIRKTARSPTRPRYRCFLVKNETSKYKQFHILQLPQTMPYYKK